MIFNSVLDFFRGKAVTIPPMDGALRPNTNLDDAELVQACPEPDNLVRVADRILFTSGNELHELRPQSRRLATYPAAITATAAAADGTLAVALGTGSIEIRDGGGAALEGFNCPVALAFDAAGDLYVGNGSDAVPPSGWASDLMQGGASGSLWHVILASGERRCLARDLAFPYGVAIDAGNSRAIVSESWRHRLIAIPLAGGAPQVVLDKLPGYPARLASVADGGYALSLFAPRNRLIEFVLREPAYRADMMAEIDPRYWIAPSFSASRSFLEPLQNGGVKTMGVHKPWSPSRSYGLVVELDGELRPIASHHSRANGTRHGVTSVLGDGDAIIAASRGGDCLLRIKRP